MTKTAKQILERVYNKGFNDRCQQEKYADIDNQFVFALSVEQAIKELEAIHQQEIARARVDELQRLYVDHDDRKLRHIDGTKLTTIEHRIAELSQILKEHKEAEL